MKFKILIFLFALTSLQISAQFTIENGPAFEQTDEGRLTKILGGNSEYFYVLRENGKGKGQKYVIEQYKTKDLTKGFSALLPIAQNAQNIESYYANDKSILFYCTQESKYETTNFYYCSVDKSGQPSGETLLLKVNNRKPEKDLYVMPSYYFSISISENKNHIAISSRTFENKGTDNKLTIAVYDSKTMAKEWDKDITETGGKNFHVDNEGNISYIAFTGDHKSEFVYINKADQKLNIFPIELNANQTIEGSKIIVTNNQAYIGGFFKDKGTNQKAGTYCIIYDINNKQKIKSKQSYFSDELQNSIFKDKTDFERSYLDVDAVRIAEDGYFFIGKDVEREYQSKDRTTYSSRVSSNMSGGTTTTNTTRTSTSTSSTLNSKSIIVFKVNSEAETEWVNNIPSIAVTPVANVRFLVSPNHFMRPEIISFSFGKQLLIFHGDTKNVGMFMKTSKLSYSLFDSKGTRESAQFFEDEKNNFLYNTMGLYGFNNAYFQNGKEIIVFFNHKENRHFGKIIFK